MKNQNSIIIKKVKKHGEEGGHGGSWKVAYADFVTAMMAFFLLLWLVTMVSPEKRARVAAYFKYFSLHTSGGTSIMDKSSEIFGQSGDNRQKVFQDMSNNESVNVEGFDSLEKLINNSNIAAILHAFQSDLKKTIAENLGDLGDQVLVDTLDDGVRIQIVDKNGSLMFEKGKTKMTPDAKNILGVISEKINPLKNKVIIEGHTDSLPYAGSAYSNWELSTERASSARKELERRGLDPERIIRVAGYAHTDPLVKDDPADPRNRRISITLKYAAAEESKSPPEKAEAKAPSDKESPKPVVFRENGSPPKNGAEDHEEEIVESSQPEAPPPPVESATKPVIGDTFNPVIDKSSEKPIIIQEMEPVKVLED